MPAVSFEVDCTAICSPSWNWLLLAGDVITMVGLATDADTMLQAVTTRLDMISNPANTGMRLFMLSSFPKYPA
jgi:hypothetical protein